MRFRASGLRYRPVIVDGITEQSIRDPAIARVIAGTPALAGADALTLEELPGGLSNTNFLVTADGEQYVLRISGRTSGDLGIDRARETAVLEVVTAAGIAPEVESFFMPEGHSVTHFLSRARPLTEAQFRSHDMIPRVAARLREIHSLDAVDGAFDPYDDIRRWLAIVDERGIAIPTRLPDLLERVADTERDRRDTEPATAVLCHNDPYYRNFLDGERLWVIDWEYAGMGDPLYDLAGVGYTLDSAGRDLLLSSYFGPTGTDRRNRLEQLIPVALCWNVAWTLLQIGASSIDFDFATFAEELLDLAPR